MKIKKILSEECILDNLKATSKYEVIAELAAPLIQKYKDLDPEEVVKVLLDREELGSTGIGEGVAIPHGKLKSSQQVIAVFGRSITGVPFNCHDDKLAHFFLVLLAPESMTGHHLQILARLSKIFKGSHFRSKLLKAKTALEIYDNIITEDEKLL